VQLRLRAGEAISEGGTSTLRRLPVVLAVVLITTLLPSLASWAVEGSLAARAEALGLSCAAETSSDGVAYTKCSGELPTFDGIGLDTDLSFPAGASAALPTMLMLHGWGQDKSQWEADAKDPSGDTYHWNNVWFASIGWVAVNSTARGFMDSCGRLDADTTCATGWTHLADRNFETRDSQFLLGTLVDAGIADPAGLVATGGSYGGGQTWLLATSLPWKSPAGGGLQLAAAVPLYPWTDLLHSLAPNGRAADGVDQSRSHERPLGVLKESYIDDLFAVGRAQAEGRYNTVDVTDQGSALDADYAVLQAGEPYDTNPLAAGLIQAFRRKSAYHADAYFDAIALGDVREVPVLSVQGLTDPLFPAVETLQMYRKLKAIDPGYPISMVFGDVGHSNAQNPPWEWRLINDRSNQFVASAVGRKAASRKAIPDTTVFLTTCPTAAETQQPITGSWDRLARGVVAGTIPAGAATTSPDPNAGDGVATDPIVHSGCLTEGSGSESGVVRSWRVPPAGLTLLGLPEVTAPYALSGVDATLAFKVWDIAGDGTKTLVTRGAYRLALVGGDPASGTIDVKLNGNAWRFEPGHVIQLQVTQVDAPYLRTDNLASAVGFGAIQIVLPVRETLRATLVPA
jgi:predicted acyl esterase